MNCCSSILYVVIRFWEREKASFHLHLSRCAALRFFIQWIAGLQPLGQQDGLLTIFYSQWNWRNRKHKKWQYYFLTLAQGASSKKNWKRDNLLTPIIEPFRPYDMKTILEQLLFYKGSKMESISLYQMEKIG